MTSHDASADTQAVRQQPSDFIHSLRGYCSLKTDQLLAAFFSRGLECIRDVDGEFTAVFDSPDECIILTSAYGVCQHYYSFQGNRFFHADTVLEVLRQANLPWMWNWRALADLAQCDHTLESDTLHPLIRRIPAASVVHFVSGRLEVKSLSWSSLHKRGRSRPELALTKLHKEISRLTHDGEADPIVSMSGGYDSRVILAALLAQGLRPRLVTVGFEDSTDVVIARQIARHFGLEHQVVTLEIADYLDAAPKIATVTNGTKVASHWHTYIYPKKAGLSIEELLFVGTNGEFARSFYSDHGWLVSSANLAGPAALTTFWLRNKVPFKGRELRRFAKGLADALTPASRLARALRLTRLCHYQLVAGLDRFYLEQRVRHFMGNGVRLYQENCSWRSPFLSRPWVEEVWGLGRRWKQGSSWHRFAVESDQPDLLDFPTTRQLKPTVGYARYAEWFCDRRIKEYVLDQAQLLGTLMEPGVAEAVVRDHALSRNRTDAMAFLIAMVAWLSNIRRAESRHATGRATYEIR